MLTEAKSLPKEFQQTVVSTILSLVEADDARFLIFSPRLNFQQAVYTENDIEIMEGEYADQWRDDPMHPSLFENSDVKVVSNTSLMAMPTWIKSSIYINFFQPHGIEHDMDVFFRRDGKIFGVLTMLRSDRARPFTLSEMALIEKVQPFIEYSMNKIFLPSRIQDRKDLMATYALTVRELDVLEYALSGLSNKELVRYLKVSIPTLRTHLQSIYFKVGVHSTSELIAKVLREIDFDSNIDSLTV